MKGRLLLAAFCVWHMAAVALYALPAVARDPLTLSLRRTLLPIVRPYVLLTSQWQQWDLFSPDPLGRVTTYAVDAERDGAWQRIETITPSTYSVFRHGTQFKLLMRLLEDYAAQSLLTERFLQSTCTQHALAPGTRVRLAYLWYLLPMTDLPLSLGAWERFAPAVNTFTGSEVLCGWPLGSGIFRPFSS